MPSFSKPEQAPVNRRRFLAGTAAITAAACIPAAAGDGIALNSIAHPSVIPNAAQQLWQGDVVKYVNGYVARVTSWSDVIAGVVKVNADAGQPVDLFTSDEISNGINHLIREIEIKDKHGPARQNANGLRIHRRRLDRAAAAVLQV